MCRRLPRFLGISLESAVDLYLDNTRFACTEDLGVAGDHPEGTLCHSLGGAHVLRHYWLGPTQPVP